jgi:hypothetical protein
VLSTFEVACLVGQSLGLLHGTIVDEQSRPVENVQVIAEGIALSVITDSKGTYSLSVPAQQGLRVRFQHISYHDTLVQVNMQAGEDRVLLMTLRSRGAVLEQIDVRASYQDGYVRVDPKLNFRVPTPTGGIESILKTMPGFYSNNELSSQYNVRGGNYDENLIYVNDIEIYRPFLVRSAQQEGMPFVNLDMTHNVKFSSGGFMANYGDKMSSVMDVEYRKPTDYQTSLSGSMLGATLHTEGKVSPKFSYIVGARFKSNTYLLKSMDTEGDYKPRFFDTQMLLSWKPSKRWEVSFLGNFSNNRYLYAPTVRETTFGSFDNLQKITIAFDGQEIDRYENYLGGLTVAFNPRPGHLIKLIFSSYYAKESETYDIEASYWLKEAEIDMGKGETVEGEVMGTGTFLEHARDQITAVVSAADLRGSHRLKKHYLTWSTKWQNEYINDRIREWTLLDSAGYVLPVLPTLPGEAVAIDDPSRILALKNGDFLATENVINTLRTSGFIQDEWKLDRDSANHFTLVGGLRYQFWSYNKEFILSPRLNFIYHPRWKQDWLFLLKTGLYYQPPFYREMRLPNGNLNPNIKAQRSFQVVVAAEYNFKWWNRPFKFTTEVYYKYLDRLISYTVDNVQIIYSGKNDARGYATGIDCRLSGEFVYGLESWVSLSIMKTAEDILDDQYTNEEGVTVSPGYIPRPTDQRFAVNIFFQDHIPRVTPLRVHLNFVFASGTPYGPPNMPRYHSLYDDGNGNTRVLRTTWYRRVDIGFSYMFLEPTRDRLKHHSKFLKAFRSCGLYFEVFNLLGIKNISSYTWISAVSSGNNVLIPVPNYLTNRLFNLKLAIEL